MYVYGDMDYYCKANFLDAFFYSSIWDESCWRCEIFYDSILRYDVAVQGKLMCVFVPGYGVWPNSSMDRHVCGLDSPGNYFYNKVL